MQTEVQKQIEAKGYTPELIRKLQESTKNPMMKAIFEGFAVRLRTRAQITVTSLTQKMQNEGFKEFVRQDAVNVIKLLGALKLGEIQMTNRGKVKALKNVRVTLQSIGLAALGNVNELKRAEFATKFIALPKPAPAIEKAHAKAKGPKLPMDQLDKKYDAELVVHFEDEIVTFKLIKGITSQQIGSFMARYYNNKVT